MALFASCIIYFSIFAQHSVHSQTSTSDILRIQENSIKVKFELFSNGAEFREMRKMKNQNWIRMVINFIGIFHRRIKCIQLWNSEAEGRKTAVCKRRGRTRLSWILLQALRAYCDFHGDFTLHCLQLSSIWDRAQILVSLFFQRRFLRKQLQIWIYWINNTKTMLTWHFRTFAIPGESLARQQCHSLWNFLFKGSISWKGADDVTDDFFLTVTKQIDVGIPVWLDMRRMYCSLNASNDVEVPCRLHQ